MTSEQISYQTEDGVTIVGTWTTGPTAKATTALLLHMMPADRTSWQPLAAAFRARNISSLAIDLRGHGESVLDRAGGTIDYRRFSDEQHQASSLDVVGAHNWLAAQDVSAESLVLVGASIGANLALQYFAGRPKLQTAVLLSPGLDYRGVQTEPALRELRQGQKLLFVASRDDQESAAAVADLDRLCLVAHEVFWYDAAGYGTAMFEGDRLLPERIADWIDRI